MKEHSALLKNGNKTIWLFSLPLNFAWFYKFWFYFNLLVCKSYLHKIISKKNCAWVLTNKSAVSSERIIKRHTKQKPRKCYWLCSSKPFIISVLQTFKVVLSAIDHNINKACWYSPFKNNILLFFIKCIGFPSYYKGIPIFCNAFKNF